MRTHTQIGERILGAAPALTQAREDRPLDATSATTGTGIRTGWPARRSPSASRVIAVCDAYDAMISNRPYRTAMSPEVAVSELQRNSGTQFDPEVVSAFVSVLAEREGAPLRRIDSPA